MQCCMHEPYSAVPHLTKHSRAAAAHAHAVMPPSLQCILLCLGHIGNGCGGAQVIDEENEVGSSVLEHALILELQQARAMRGAKLIRQPKQIVHQLLQVGLLCCTASAHSSVHTTIHLRCQIDLALQGRSQWDHGMCPATMAITLCAADRYSVGMRLPVPVGTRILPPSAAVAKGHAARHHQQHHTHLHGTQRRGQEELWG
jgi:hypothetical protein